jgi:DNA segregation ATPase FtsK/SpoIIIE, S-DNA-T family
MVRSSTARKPTQRPPGAKDIRRVPDGASIVVGRAPVMGETDGRWTIGDATLSFRHCRLSVLSGELCVDDLGSTNGTVITDHEQRRHIRVGTTELLARPAAATDGAGPSVGDDFDPVTGTFAHRRPPTPRRRVEPIDVPAVRSAGRARMRVRPGAFLGPLIGAAAMALFFDPKFAAFALLSPILMIVNMIDDRRSAGRERRTGERDFASALAAFIPAVRAQVVEAAAFRAEEFPGFAVVVGEGGASRMWRARPGVDAPWPVRCGTGPQRPVPVLREHGPRADAVTTLLDELVVDDGPITVDLRAGSVIVVVGERAANVVRAIVAQAALTYGPSALAVYVDDTPSWAAWCPQVCSEADPRRLTLVAEANGHRSGVGSDVATRHPVGARRPNCRGARGRNDAVRPG